MLRRTYFFALFLILVASMFSATISVNVKATTTDVAILSHNPYVDSLGYYTIVGEVQNQGTKNLHYVKITATFYDSANNVLATDFTYTDIDILIPQQKSPFELNTYPSKITVDHYSVVVSSYSETGEVPYRSLRIQGLTTSTDSLGYYHVIGEVENTGQVDTTYVKIVVTFYNSNGKVIAKDFTYTDPIDIAKGSKAPFDASSYPLKITPARYLVQVQCSESMPSSSISCSVSSTSISIGSSITVSGSITPACSGVTVTLSYTLPNATVFKRTVTSASDSKYSDTYTPSAVGSWSVKASWEGDASYAGATSSSTSFTVSKISTTISCSTSSSEITEGDSVTVSGSISPAVSGKTVTLTYKKPDGSTFTRTVSSGSDGSYSDSYKPNVIGSWNVSASWAGDSTYDGASSSSKSLNVKKKGCIIATATYGSELSPEVQFLRDFRDNTVLSTFAGSSFMTVFNGFYYSFSPSVASTISDNEVFRGVMKVVLYPLIGTLHISSVAFSIFSFSPELAVVVTGLIASSLIALVYVTPWVLLLSFLNKFRPSTKIIRFVGLVWAN